MPNIPLKIPPGFYRVGTVYDSKGRWYDGTLVRFVDKAVKPVNPWMEFITSSGMTYAQLDLGAPVLDAFAFFDGETTGAVHKPWIAIATEDRLYYVEVGGPYVGGPQVNVMPGEMDSGAYLGASIDLYGTDIVAIMRATDPGQSHPLPVGPLVYVITSTAESTPGAVVTEAPQGFSVFVTPEGYAVVLGANGNRRKLAWHTQGDITDWTPTEDNDAGDYDITGGGLLLTGKRLRNESLIFTNTDLWSMRFDTELTYVFHQLGQNCGLATEHGAAVIGGKAVWLGKGSFYGYDGFVQPIPCSIEDMLFGSTGAAIKFEEDVQYNIRCVTNAAKNEVTWFYTSYDSPDGKNDRYVSLNVTTGDFLPGVIRRSGGVDAGITDFPVWIDTEGKVWVHEVAFGATKVMPDATAFAAGYKAVPGVSAEQYTPLAESGDVELDEGDNVMHIRKIIPDGLTTTDVQTYLLTRMGQTDDETENGPFTMAVPHTDVRLTARLVRVKLIMSKQGGRFGTPKIEVVSGGRR